MFDIINTNQLLTEVVKYKDQVEAIIIGTDMPIESSTFYTEPVCS